MKKHNNNKSNKFSQEQWVAGIHSVSVALDEKIDIAELKAHIQKGTIEKIHCTGKIESDCTGLFKDGRKFSITIPDITSYEVSLENILSFNARTPGFFDYFMSFAPWLLIILFWFFLMRKMQGSGGQNGIFNFSNFIPNLPSLENVET